MQVHPSQISPGESFDLFYFLRNPTDSTTYYVRAKLYDVRTGELLDTVALDQSSANSHLFIKTTQAPPDPSGYGRNIVAIASIYTDSIFTTKSTDYEEQEQYYLIKAVMPVLGGGGIDFRALREMFIDVLRETLPVPQIIPLDALFGTLGVLQREVNRIPKELFDAAPFMADLAAIREQIAALPKPQDLSPLADQFAGVVTSLLRLQDSVKGLSTTLPKEHSAAIETATREISNSVKGALASVVTHLSQHEQRPKEPVESPLSITHLFGI